MADFATNPRALATTITGERGPENEVSQRIIADVDDTISDGAQSASVDMNIVGN